MSGFTGDLNRVCSLNLNPAPMKTPTSKIKITIKSKRGGSLRQVILLRVFLNHPPRVVLRHEGGHCAANFFNPRARNALRVAVEEARDYFLGEGLIEFGAVTAVLLLNR